jgi:ATP-dependent Lon protease
MNAQIRELSVLPLKNAVLLPYVFTPLSAGRAISIAGIDAAMEREDKEIIVVAQRDPAVEEPGQGDLFEIGTRAVIRKLARAGGGVQLLIQGMDRIRIEGIVQEKPYLCVEFREAPLTVDGGTEAEALQREVLSMVIRMIKLTQPNAPDTEVNLPELLQPDQDPARLVYTLASLIGMEFEKEQALYEADTSTKALELLHDHLQHELQVQEMRGDIRSKAQEEMSKQQREFFLREQMRAIQRELGEGDAGTAEVEELRKRLAEVDLPGEVRKETERELERLGRLHPASPEHSVIRTYIELVLEIPWQVKSDDVLDLGRARQVMDEDHHDLEEVKDRIYEHLATLKLNPGAKAPILCFVGAPGTGKTSLGRSVARALNRKFERMSLGGLHDEAELRGHRRTYIGAMPGRIIQAIRRVGVNNPVLMLDEVDKLGRDFRGDPASAMLEILDPEQNFEFRDNYLELPFDLSKVFFITTANTLGTIPRPLLDRMEVLHLSGYSEEEKLAIAKRYLVPRQRKEVGLSEHNCAISDAALTLIIRRYTREAGVRQLERSIGRVFRKTGVQIAEDKEESVNIAPNDLLELLGPEPFHLEEARKESVPGVAAGLAWTETGGEVLFVETTLLPGEKGLTLTGHLGQVMQESAKAAQSYLWSHAEAFGIASSAFTGNGVHVHVPSGAIPKDGPSAGITIAAAMASLYCDEPARADTAMTGEITITGLVLPVGGIKEKVLAARRASFLRIILPRKNESSLRDVPQEVRDALEVVLVDRIEEVLHAAIPKLRKSMRSTIVEPSVTS